MRICVRVTAARTHSWMARYGSSDTAATPSIPSSRVKPIALVDARNRNRPSEAPQIGTDITLAHCQHRVPRIGGAPQQKLGPFGNVRERPLPYRTHPPFLVLVPKTECSRRAARRRRNRPRPRRTDYTCPASGTVQHDARAGRHVRGRARRIGCGRQHQTDHHGAARARNRTNSDWMAGRREGTSDGTPADRVNKRITRFRIEKIEFFGFGGTLSMRFCGNCAPIYASGFIR